MWIVNKKEDWHGLQTRKIKTFQDIETVIK